jgi:ribosome recycling factor
VARQMTEKSRVAVRSIRQEANEQVKTLQKESAITEDEKTQGMESVQNYTNDYIAKMDQMLADKEKEMLTF